MIRALKKRLTAWPDLQALLDSCLFFNCGHCPGGCRDGSAFRGPTGRVYRSSRRSLTFQCTKCTLQWTMTVHRLAQAAARRASAPDAPGELHNMAHMWAELASRVEEQRGRRKSPPRTSAPET
jgi:hypothetical protein